MEGKTKWVKGVKANHKMGSGVSPEKKKPPLTHVVRMDGRL